ncbi:hypothetical protein VTO42DRAFT_8972 [Malbranchea cinnamomea]
MATVVVQQQTVRHSSTPPPVSQTLSLGTPPSRSQTPLPKRHLPACPTGPAPSSSKASTSSAAFAPSLRHSDPVITQRFLYPPDKFPQISTVPAVYSINSDQLATALDELAARPLPDPKHVFPWLHGLHPDNQIQLAFFLPRRKTLRRAPKCLQGITVVKYGGDLTKSRIKGAVAPDEILDKSTFIDADPTEGFSVRSFHIQTAKMAPLSDIVVYGEDGVKQEDVLSLAREIATAQKEWRKRFGEGQETQLFNTFTLADSFQELEEKHPEIVAIDSGGDFTGEVMDFFHWERVELRTMSAASEISQNVWVGPTPDWPALTEPTTEDLGFDILIDAHDVATIPDPRFLAVISDNHEDSKEPIRLEFPSSGSVLASAWGDAEIYDFIDMCRWIYHVTHPAIPNPSVDADGDIAMVQLTPASPRKVLIHCTDGYTESSLLAIGYFMFAEGVPVHEAWLRLHCEKKRNFFAYPSDVTFLTSIQNRLLLESPVARTHQLSKQPDPGWLAKMDGSLPSRILPHMYLGNLAHANNPELLRALGIRRLLSIGEPVSWPRAEVAKWGSENMMMIDDVQDNGIDPLTPEFNRCLEFIERGKVDGTATLVHCRVGVSRSATICIAEVMTSLGLSFPRAYCFVRARRLNVIIQPHLRFVYELLKWDEHLQKQRGQPYRRDLEWATIAREIALMNKPYSRQT